MGSTFKYNLKLINVIGYHYSDVNSKKEQLFHVTKKILNIFAVKLKHLKRDYAQTNRIFRNDRI